MFAHGRPQPRLRDRGVQAAYSNEENRTVKRTVGILTGLAALGVMAYFGSFLWAQAPAQPTGQPTAQPAGRIGILNMVEVLKNYKKFANTEAQLRQLQQTLEKRLEPYRAQANALKAKYTDVKTSAAEKEQVERDMRKLQVDAQVAEEDAKKELMKFSGEAYVAIYHEVEDAVKRFSAANGYSLVLFYNDSTKPEELYHPANVQRKLLQPAAIMPMVVSPGMDITTAIANNLNAMYPAAAAAPAAPGTAPAAPH